MAHRKWRETKQLSSVLPGPAVLGCCLISFRFLWAIHPIRPVEMWYSLKFEVSHRRREISRHNCITTQDRDLHGSEGPMSVMAQDEHPYELFNLTMAAVEELGFRVGDIHGNIENEGFNSPHQGRYTMLL